ncbi:hypothetical protein AADZ91_05510 [Colwelliaceae bacterium 6441]
MCTAELLTQRIDDVSKQVIVTLQEYIVSLGFTPVIHFELEGCYHSSQTNKPINFSTINQQLLQLNIAGEVIPEYWHQQWEYVSLFQGQSPLQEADYLSRAIKYLPFIFAQQGVEQTLIKPVVWQGDKGKLAIGCHNIFSGEKRAVHIPNAIQMNVSVKNSEDHNIIVDASFGEYLQQCFLETSKESSLLYLPEEEAFERFALKTKYGLAEELCSPNDISGGHQGSIALYKERGKHNQLMGEEPLLYDHHNNVLLSENDWQKFARIEHRLGASSVYYNAYLNVIYGLLNIIDALDVFIDNQCTAQLKTTVCQSQLPVSLYCQNEELGAIELFNQETWFAASINKVDSIVRQKNHKQTTLSEKIGDKLKAMILANYQIPSIITNE